MAEEEESFEGLRKAIDAFAADLAPELIAEARAEAMSRARRMLADAMVESLLDQAGAELGAGSRRIEPEPRRRERPSTEQRHGGESGRYVYGVAAAAEAALPEGLVGIDESHPVMLIRHGDLAAIAGQVSLSEFGEQELMENLNDVEWLEAKARAHEQVLDAALVHMTVVPLRLCTIYKTEDDVREMLDREQGVFAEALQRLAGKTEWGVKVIADPGAVDRAAAAMGEQEAWNDEQSASAGVAYLRERSSENRAREQSVDLAEDWAREAHEFLAVRASEALRNPLQNPELSGESGEMLLNGVYLVDDDEIDAFQDAVAELDDRFRSRGASAELTGPWPPYNFVKGSIEAAR